MSFRFRRSITLFPGVRVNLSKRGLSLSAGVPGATLNFSSRGTALTLGLPGTGLSYRTRLTGFGHDDAGRAGAHRDLPCAHGTAPSGSLPEPAAPPVLEGEIRSGDVATLTTPDLAGLKRLIDEAVVQRENLARDFAAVVAQRQDAWIALKRAEQFPLKLFSRRKLPGLQIAYKATEAELSEIADAHQASQIQIDFAFDDDALGAFQRLEEAHQKLSASAAIWDVTSSVAIDRHSQRTSATSAITRTRVRLTRSTAGIVTSRWVGLSFGNANGEELELFPAFCLIRRKFSSDYALVDIRDINLVSRSVSFIEDEQVPYDAKIVGQTWKKVNLDGSRDKRFKDNFQIPIVEYARIDFMTDNGVAEAYMVSNTASGASFVAAFVALQSHLRRLSEGDEKDVAGSPSVGAGTALAAETGPRSLVPPPLPHVPPAHGYTVGAVAAAAALGLAAWVLIAPQQFALRSEAVPPSAAIQAPQETGRGSGRAPSSIGVTTDRLEPQQSGSGANRPLTTIAPADPGFSGRERLQTRQGANLRAEPSGAANVIRVVPRGAVLVVFDRRGSWVQVGDTQPSGWIHDSLLESYHR